MIHTELSEYERIRQKNIERNYEFLEKIGMSPKSHDLSSSTSTSTAYKSKSKSNKSLAVDVDSTIVRRSSRISQVLESPVKMSEPIKKRKVVQDDQSEDDGNGNIDKKESHKRPSTYIRSTPSSDTSRAIHISYDRFLNQYLSHPIDTFGKAAVMEIANNGVIPRFNKYSGVVEWINCVFLWVNICDHSSNQSQYPNEFIENGQYIRWFGGSKMSKDSEVIHRLCKCKSGSAYEDTILLFVRLEGESYACLGRLAWESCDIDSNPVTFVWKLLDHDAIKQMPYFQKLLKMTTSSCRYTLPKAAPVDKLIRLEIKLSSLQLITIALRCNTTDKRVV